MALSKLTYLAVKRQTITTPSVAVVPTHFLRFKEGDLDASEDKIINNPIQNNVWGALNVVAGKQTCEGTYKFDLDPNECVHWLAAGLGGLATADISSGTDASVFSQTITVANALPYLCVEQTKGDITDTTNNRQNYHVSRAYGVRVDSFTMKGADNLIEFEVKLKALGVFDFATMLNNEAAGSSVVIELDTVEGLVVTSDTVNMYDETPQNEIDAIAALSTSAKTITIATLGNSYTTANRARVTLEPQSPSFSVPHRAFSFVHVNIQYGTDLTAAASASEENIETWEFSFMNDLQGKHGTIRAGYSVLEPLERKATFKYTKYFENKQDWYRYRQTIKRACIITISDGVTVSATDTGLKKYQVKINMSDVRFTSHEMKTGNNQLYYYDIEGTLMYDSSDARALQIVVQNAMAGTTYTA